MRNLPYVSLDVHSSGLFNYKLDMIIYAWLNGVPVNMVTIRSKFFAACKAVTVCLVGVANFAIFFQSPERIFMRVLILRKKKFWKL